MELNSKIILVTGCAGFIASKIAELLLEQGTTVIGLDNVNDAYSPILKEWRLARIQKFSNFEFHRTDIINLDAIKGLFQQYKFDAVMNLAARAGVRASVENPWVYVSTNVTGTLNLLELCKDFNVKKFILASTSSIYGTNETPFNEDDKADKQLSPYAATKKGAEALAYTYHYLYGIDITIPRYFTVYGPAGRPDMMPFKFIHNIAEGIPIPVYGDGTQERDFTYVDDIARGSIACLKSLGYEVINLGSDRPVKVNYVIQLMEQYLDKKAIIEYQPAHPADVPATWADISKARKLLSWNSSFSIEEGIQNAVNWYLENKDWLKNVKV
ncbi:MAG: UDP-glucuronate 4-epimerase [Candidatus Poribacteria bacterium]|nr:UDP-glucuronate 4-epimerase [Candidatus Poribacteria bacterium]